MSVIAESKSELLVFKEYADATMDAITEPDPATDPAAAGGQVLRHISHSLSHSADQYRPDEKRRDAQQPMGTAGSRQVGGDIKGYLSPGTHQALFAGALRSTWSAPVTASETDFTSAAFDGDASTVTFAAGDPVAKGIRVGMVLRFTNLSEPTNNAKNFVVLGFSGGSNRVVELFPEPTMQAADTAFNVTSVGKTLINPAAGLTNHKFAFEWYNPDADFSRLATECRVSAFNLGAPVNSNVTLDFSVMGRGRLLKTGADAPFFASPTAETDTDIPSGMDGLLRFNGSVLGVTSALTMKCDLKGSVAKQKNPTGLVGGVLLDNFALTGDFTAFVDGPDLFDAYDSKTEIELLQYYPSNGAIAAPAQVFYLPRIRLTGCTEQEVDGAKAVQCTWEAARYFGSAPGVESTTLQIADTEAA